MNKLRFVEQGSGPVVVLSHALGCTLQMWDAVAAELAPRFTVLRYDQPGHGGSPAATPPFSVEDLADDAAALIEQVARESVHFVGLSLGGMVAQSLAARHPERVKSIVIANSASHYDDAAKALWNVRIDAVRKRGVASVADGAIERWFTARFRSDPIAGGADIVRRMREQLVRIDAAQYAASCEAVSAIDFRQSNARIACPALVIAGGQDVAAPPALSRQIAETIPRARLESIDAAHLSAVEKPREFAALLLAFWRSV